MPITSPVTLVVPCFNEEARLPGDAFRRFLGSTPAVRILFVDDGSRDGTAATLQALARQLPDQIRVLLLARNHGKAEAVRQGLIRALQPEEGPRPAFVGYWDADLATPLEELSSLVAVFQENPAARLVMGVRIKLMGWKVERGLFRHYAGRVFATCAAAMLGEEIYDTQCGAKLLRVDDDLPGLLADPMHSRWLLDVELLFRLRRSLRLSGIPRLDRAVVEVPLHAWREIGKSKVKAPDFFRALWGLVRLRGRYRT